MNRKLMSSVAVALFTLSASACSRSNDDAAPPANYAGDAAERTEEPAPRAPATSPSKAPAAAPATNMAAATTDEAAPAPPPDEQMMDDASATGMTARSSRGEPSANDSAPDDTEIK